MPKIVFTLDGGAQALVVCASLWWLVDEIAKIANVDASLVTLVGEPHLGMAVKPNRDLEFLPVNVCVNWSRRPYKAKLALVKIIQSFLELNRIEKNSSIRFVEDRSGEDFFEFVWC